MKNKEKVGVKKRTLVGGIVQDNGRSGHMTSSGELRESMRYVRNRDRSARVIVSVWRRQQKRLKLLKQE